MAVFLELSVLMGALLLNRYSGSTLSAGVVVDSDVKEVKKVFAPMQLEVYRGKHATGK